MTTSRYKAELVKLMTFKDDKKYDVGHNSTPDLLCRRINKRAYGDPEPNEDMRPFHIRLSTLQFAKKAISAFMPRFNTTWDPVTKQVPTRSDDVNKLIRK
ncbi:hypothetical protein JG687_00008796 [Phytophthora cactorum]|uniref:Uncharacterized protein n=1 Tax=Phytophthora cactorum TaxID=29920 RepID=A0A329RU03_9STRA|nr:hypothetical protein Pcac1_g19502 [Phytophthora cactorum]KAG2814499.1 hypothetical protein PC111_g13962 [Phytophthora cactorum]KAG2852259.1 hypothetical protein PC113_g15190 [Phytophthora cactorum]KAG2892779.1 hypothetical protein PC114_g16507 [Phytophthora cactorum]KAG2922929.1 hypothetical protein PC117_g15871 [Phytophthora cactorum]